MKKVIKRLIAALLAVVLVIGAVAGGMLIYRNVSRKPVNAYPVSDICMTDYWGDSAQTYGEVTTQGMQVVSLSSTQTVTKVCVKEGQTVKKGDELLEYDTTLSTLEVTRAEIAVKKQELQLETAKKDLEKIKAMKPYTPQTDPDPEPDPEPETETETETETEEEEVVPVTGPVYVQGSGTETDPYVYLCPADWEWTQQTLQDFYTGEAMKDSPLKPSQEEDQEEEKEDQPSSEEENTEEKQSTEEADTEKPSAEEAETEKSSTEEADTEKPSAEEAETEKTTTEEAETEKPSTEETENEKSSTEEAETEKTTTEETGTGETGTEETKTEAAKTAEAGKKLLSSRTAAAPSASANKNRQVWVTVLFREGDSEEGALTGGIGLILAPAGKEVSFVFYSPDLTLYETSGDETEEDAYADDSYDYEDYSDYSSVDESECYTSAEIAEMRNEKEKEIRDLDLEIRIAKVDLEEKQKELNDGAVYAEMDGEITVVRDPEEAYQNSQSVIELSAGGGYYITGTMSEMELDSVTLGQTVSISSWQTGVSCEGTITEISEYPAEYGDSWSDGNTNVSYYPFTVFVEAGAGLQEYEYVEMEYTQESGEEGSSWYLENPYILTENGKSYVYVLTKDNKLEKRQISTGRDIWGSYTEILGGLSMDAYIAFPYGDAADGAKAQAASIDELYGSY